MKSKDRRFIEFWEDQRKGSKTGYYITYILGWGVVIFFVLFFASKLLTNLWRTGGPYLGLVFVLISLIASLIVTHLTWTGNEKRYGRLLDERRERLN